MRLWTVHPQYLDPVGLVALWREALLARAVLEGATKGYRHHPQLTRFRAHRDPVACINRYLLVVHTEAGRRGYAFDERKIVRSVPVVWMPETSGQLSVEWEHLLGKLRARRPEQFRSLRSVTKPAAHPLFRIVAGERREWERGAGRSAHTSGAATR